MTEVGNLFNSSFISTWNGTSKISVCYFLYSVKKVHPAISLRLRYYINYFDYSAKLSQIYVRDMSKPTLVLTGLDYWLDNLMCNVPELATIQVLCTQ